MSDAAEGNVAANERHLTLKNLKFFSPLRREFVVERYGIALATAALAIVLRWIFDPLLGHVAFYVTVYAAVAFCSILCGYAPAIVSAVVGFMGIFTSSSIPAILCLRLAHPKFMASSAGFLSAEF
jgi:hypothetical protein